MWIALVNFERARFFAPFTMMKLTYGNCQRSILEALMKNGHSSDEAMAIWNATKLHRFEDVENAGSNESTPEAAPNSHFSKPSESEGRQTKDLAAIISEQRAAMEKKESSFSQVLREREDAFYQAKSSLERRNGGLHNRRITLESTLKSIRRLTSDAEIANIIRLALMDTTELQG